MDNPKSTILRLSLLEFCKALERIESMEKCDHCGKPSPILFEIGTGVTDSETGYVDSVRVCAKCVDAAEASSDAQRS